MKLLIWRDPKKWLKIWMSKHAYTKLKEHIIREFLKEWRSQSAEMFDSVEDMDIMVKYFNRKQKELEGEE